MDLNSPLINKLNHDCLAKVFMHLPVLERLEMENVCQKWEEAVDLSWYNVKKLDWNDLMITLEKREETLEMIMRKCGRYLTHLTIIDDHYPWMSSLLKDNCKNIINFSIKIKNEFEWKISKEDLVEIIGLMPNLKYLKVEISGFVPRDYSRKIVNKLPVDIHEIHLFVQDLKNNGSRQIAPDLERFNSLRSLTLKGFELTNETLEGILQNKKTLSKVDLSSSKYPPNPQSIFESLNNLEHLNLTWVENLSLNEVTTIAHNCLKLKHFEFYFLERGTIENEGIPYSIYRQLKNLNLEHLQVGRINKFGYEDENLLSGMTKNWKQLKYLNIQGGYDFTNADFQEITKLNNLEYVDLVNANVDSKLFIKIANNCLKLKNMRMTMHKLSKAATFEFSNLKKIEKLCFFNDNLTDYLLGRIADNCKNLVDLELNSCYNITEDSLIKVGKLEHLKKLNLFNIKNVPNAIFDNNFKKLENLSCEYCPSVTDEGIKKVLDNCQKLSYLSLCKTGITVESLVHASKRKFVFKLLEIWVDLHVKNEYEKIICTPSPYLIVK